MWSLGISRDDDGRIWRDGFGGVAGVVDAVVNHVHAVVGQLEFVGASEPAAPGLARELEFVFGFTSLLSFFLSPHGKGFINFGRRGGRWPAQFLFAVAGHAVGRSISSRRICG